MTLGNVGDLKAAAYDLNREADMLGFASWANETAYKK